MKGGVAAAIVVLLVILGATAGLLAGTSSSGPSTLTRTSTVTSTAQTDGGGEAFLTKVNGSYYWTDDVSRDITIGMPGYSYFHNGSVAFDGVRFATVCPPIYVGCPVAAGTTATTSVTVMAGAISFNMTFPDKSTETDGGVVGDSTYVLLLSTHTPKAGMLIEWVNDYSGNGVDYAVFLLVSSCGAPSHLC
jgi:hypothetical protein